MIYNEQHTVKSLTGDIIIFLNMDGNTVSWESLKKRKITQELADCMEGDLTLYELEDALF